MTGGIILELTFEQYDRELEIFEKMKTKTLWPSDDDLALFERNPEKYILFACYLLEKGNTPSDSYEKKQKKKLNDFVNKHLSLL